MDPERIRNIAGHSIFAMRSMIEENPLITTPIHHDTHQLFFSLKILFIMHPNFFLRKMTLRWWPKDLAAWGPFHGGGGRKNNAVSIQLELKFFRRPRVAAAAAAPRRRGAAVAATPPPPQRLTVSDRPGR